MTLTEHDYRMLVEDAPIMIWRADAQGACDYFNERWLAFTGRSMEQEIGNGWATGVHPDDRDRCLRTYSLAFERRDFFEMEYRLRRSDGEYRWILDRGGPVMDGTGRFRGYIGSCIDVTERVVAREALAHAHNTGLRILSGLLPLCAWCRRIRDVEGRWQTLEAYLHEHADTRFTHGMCPECQQLHGPPDQQG